jgi:CubicO group peptidase (beta-lactamase class C family)
MEQDAAWLDDPAGAQHGACCLSMTLRDYARFGQFMLDGGQAGGGAVLPPGWVADATAATGRALSRPRPSAFRRPRW